MVEIISHLTWTIFGKKIHPFLLRKSFHLVRAECRTITSMDRRALRYVDKQTNTTSFCRRQQQWTSFKSGVGTNRLWLQYHPYPAQCNELDQKNYRCHCWDLLLFNTVIVGKQYDFIVSEIRFIVSQILGVKFKLFTLKK